jgi:hypothetical protein
MNDAGANDFAVLMLEAVALSCFLRISAFYIKILILLIGFTNYMNIYYCKTKFKFFFLVKENLLVAYEVITFIYLYFIF